MVLVDTSIWVAHLRQGSRQLEKLLIDAKVICHPFIIGELACGNLKNRNEIISFYVAGSSHQTRLTRFLFIAPCARVTLS
jgi:predicted nucleic acid-binding protein